MNSVDDAIAAFGAFDFVVWVEKRDARYRVQVLQLSGDNFIGVSAHLFKVKTGATVLEALRSIAGYHSELARLFEADDA